jgi:hypothetical protein
MFVPICQVCGEHEVGTFTGSAEYCSNKCEQEANDFLEMVYAESNRDEHRA